jgi:hypothetical protein
MGWTRDKPSTEMAGAKQLNWQRSVGHFFVTLEQGQSLPDAPMLISASTACIMVIAAETGKTTRLAASKAAPMMRTRRIHSP